MNSYEFLSLAVILSFTVSCSTDSSKTENNIWFFGNVITQESVVRIDMMPDIPSTYNMIDWKEKAREYDSYVFDRNRINSVGPLVWSDKTEKNISQETFGLYTTVGDSRQGPSNSGGANHEAINTIAAVLSGGLAGIDKTKQDGYDYPKMLQNYYAVSNGWKIMLNNTSGYASDWWYNVLPNILYYGVCDVFPSVSGADDIQKSIADQFARADEVLGSSYDYSYFNFGEMKGVTTGIPFQQDAAGGQGYVLLCAYRKFGDASYLQHCENAIKVLDSQKESRFYEILLPFGAYTAAYLNAAEGKDYDVKRMLNWIFTGCQSSSGRKGWGVISGTWGNYDVSGLQGSTTDGGGYAFLMNSFEMAWPLVPLVKYQPQFALAIGKWMLNNASACRLFYPGNIDDAHQYAPELKDLTSNNIAYEGLRYQDRYGKASLSGVSPVAEGDGPTWTPDNPTSTMFSLYSTSPVGIFGAIVKKTNVEGILRLDCNATDFYAGRQYPEYLYYNPYGTTESVTYQSSASNKFDLFDIVSRSYLVKNVDKKCPFDMLGKSARVIVELPSGTVLSEKDGKICDEDSNIIAYY
jgi:hypothetical protein